MKLIVWTLCTILMAFIIITLTSCAENNKISVTLEQAPINFQDGVSAVLIEGTPFAPVRGIFEALGYSVYWNDDAQKIIIKSSYECGCIAERHFTIGSATMVLVNECPYMDADGQLIKTTSNTWDFHIGLPPQIINGEAMISVLALSIGSGRSVEWDENSRTLKIHPIPIVYWDISSEPYPQKGR